MENIFETQAQEFDQAVAELEAEGASNIVDEAEYLARYNASSSLEWAAAHMRHVANHFRNREIPRAAAHIVAVQGHMLKTQRILDEFAIQHTTKASV